MEKNSNNAVQAKNSVTSTANETQPMTLKVECLINSKVLYWTTGLTAGSAIGLTALVAWKLIRDRKR